MNRVRVIPALLIQNGGLVKSIKFKDHKYVGDPINAVKIFNEKEVDEIVVLDISATAQKRPPNISVIQEIASEAFMPLGYGGGITKLDEIKELIASGVEKVILNTISFECPQLVRDAATISQRHKSLTRNFLYYRNIRRSLLRSGRNIQDYNFVYLFFIKYFYRIYGIAYIFIIFKFN